MDATVSKLALFVSADIACANIDVKWKSNVS